MLTAEARIVHGMPDAEYRSDPAISQSSLKLILDCPARYKWEQQHPTIKKAFDFGHVVHAELLGAGMTVHCVEADSWRTKAANDEAKQARADGMVSVLAHEYETIQDCVKAVREHPLAGPMIAYPGDSEVAMFWTDERTRIACKALADRVTVTDDGTHYLTDVKTVGRSARPGSFARDAASFGYHIQDSFYLDGYEAITGVRARFLNVTVETSPPHFVSVVELDDEAIDVGRGRYQEALDLYQKCRETDVWPGYTENFAEVISLPRWATY